MIAIFLPFSFLWKNTDATVVSSSRPEHLTIPAFLNNASTAESDEANDEESSEAEPHADEEEKDDNPSDLASRTRAELADLDDLDL